VLSRPNSPHERSSPCWRRSFLHLALRRVGAATTTTRLPVGGNSANLIKSNPANNGIHITVGSKNFTEEYILGKHLRAGPKGGRLRREHQPQSRIRGDRVQALQDGQVSGYPEYHVDAFSSPYSSQDQGSRRLPRQRMPRRSQELQPKGETAFEPTPFADANALGTLKTPADDLGLTTISDLQGKSQN